MNFKIKNEINKIFNRTGLLDYIYCKELYKNYLKNYYYVTKVYEFFLKKLTHKLNSIHNVNYSKNNWRFLLGPWLFLFISDVFCKFKYLKKKKLIRINENYSNLYIPKNTNEFMYKLLDENYHKNIFQQFSSLRFNKILFFEHSNNVDIFIFFFKKIYIFIQIFLSQIIKNKIIFFFSYFSHSRNFFLQLSLKQIPFFLTEASISKCEINYKLRKFNLIKNNNFSMFYKILDKLIPYNIPISYFENFRYLHSNIFKYYPNIKPKIIFSSNYDPFDYFKIYCLINKTIYNTKLVAGQHGGVYFSQNNHFFSTHIQKLFKNIVVLGYKKKNNYFPIFFLMKKKTKPNFLGKALFINYQYSIFPTMCSCTSGKNGIKFLNDTLIFFNNLNKKVTTNILFKSYPYKPFKKIYKILENKYNFHSLEKNIFDILKNCRLNIVTWNSTAILESLNINFPTIVFFRPDLTTYGKKSYNLLKKANIFFDNPKDAAKKINEIWDNVENWWFEKERQKLVTEFCNRMCKRSENTNNELKEYFKKLI